jgi:hypothetical protein
MDFMNVMFLQSVASDKLRKFLEEKGAVTKGRLGSITFSIQTPTGRLSFAHDITCNIGEYTVMIIGDEHFEELGKKHTHQEAWDLYELYKN